MSEKENVQRGLAPSGLLACDGACEDSHGGHAGIVKAVIVTRPGSPRWEFYYCENARAEDESRGFTVTEQANVES